MSLKDVERQLKQLEERLSCLEEVLERHMLRTSGAVIAPTPQDAVKLADAVSSLLLSVQEAVAKSLQPLPAGQRNDVADKFAELDEVLMRIFKQADTQRPQ